MNNLTYFSELSPAVRLSWQSSVKAGRPLALKLLSFIGLVGGASLASWVKVIYAFAWHCSWIMKTQGVRGLCLRLKAYSTVLMSVTAGKKHKDLTQLGPVFARTKSGLPRIIPVKHRQRIRSGDWLVTRAWLSLFGLYRVLDFKGVFSVDTIIAPFEGTPRGVRAVSRYSEFFVRQLMMWDIFPLSSSDVAEVLKPEYFAVRSSGPNSRNNCTSIGMCWYDALVWVNNPLFGVLAQWLSMVGGVSILGTMKRLASEADDIYLLWQSSPKRISRPLDGSSGRLGKLGVKEEPGKVRVFAIVDYWTQITLRPLHRWLFKILKRIPQDGTFDQLAPVRALVKNYPNETMYSFDLKAATDRVPWECQVALLNQLLPGAMGDLWGKLLRDRDYYFDLSSDHFAHIDVQPGHSRTGRVRYEVGQPMGAYSSWAMLALVHHMIVQYAAFRVGMSGWFSAYAVLGDDVVIANRKVALQYREILKGLGVRISIAKTLVGRGSCEFAKRFFLKGKDTSPVSLLEFALGRYHLPIMVELVRKLGAVWEPKLSKILRAAGFGYRVQGRITSPLPRLGGRVLGLLLTLRSPGVSPWSVGNWREMLDLLTLNPESRDPYSLYQCIRDKVSVRIGERIERVRSSLYTAQSEALTLDGFDVYWWAVIYRRLYVASLDHLDDLTRRVKPVAELDPVAKEMVKGNHECLDDIVSFMQGWWDVSDELASLKDHTPFEDRSKEMRYRSKEGRLIRLLKSLIRVSRGPL